MPLPNYSYHLTTLAVLQAFYTTPRIAIARAGWLDNVHPRTALDRMEASDKFDKELVRRLRRRQAAHENCLESLGPFCAAVVAANTAGVPGGQVTVLAGGYVALRVVFVWLYLNIKNQRLSLIRTLVWYASTFTYLALFWKAGNAMLRKEGNL